MNRARNILLAIALTFAVVAGAGQAVASAAFDSGVRTPVLGDSRPGAVSVPFEIPIRQNGANPQPLHFEVAVQGFKLDPEPVNGRRIGSLDFLTDSGKFGNKAIYSNGPGGGNTHTWTLDWQLSDENLPIVATVYEGLGLDLSGQQVQDPEFTLFSFTMPGNYHGFPVNGLSFRFNQDKDTGPSEGVGAVNPSEPGTYRITSHVVSAAPENAVSVASAFARVGLPPVKTALRVKPNRKKTRPGHLVRFRLKTINETKDLVAIWLGGRRLARVPVGPAPNYFQWRPTRELKGRTVKLRFKPEHGPARQVAVKVTRR